MAEYNRLVSEQNFFEEGIETGKKQRKKATELNNGIEQRSKRKVKRNSKKITKNEYANKTNYRSNRINTRRNK